MPSLEDRSFAFTFAQFLLSLASALALFLSIALLEIGPLVTLGTVELEEERGFNVLWDGAQPATRADVFELGVTRTMLGSRIKIRVPKEMGVL